MIYNRFKRFAGSMYGILFYILSKPLIRKGNFVLLANNNIKSLSTLSPLKIKTSDLFLQQTHIRISSHVTSKALHEELPKYRNHAINLKKQLDEYGGPETNSIIWAHRIYREYEEKYGLRKS